MIITQSADARNFFAKNLTSTSEITVFEVGAKIVSTIESLGISCGTSTTLTLKIKDGTNTFIILNGATLAANTTIQFPVPDFFASLKSGWSLTAQAAAANQVCVFGSKIDAMEKRAGPAA